MPTTNGLFADQMFTATDLNRRGGVVLDSARNHPVTISRNNEQFALFPREQAAKLVRTVEQMNSAFCLLAEAQRVSLGESASPFMSWMAVYDKEDLQRLTSEVFSAISECTSGMADWIEVEGVIHAWRESAIIAQGGALDHGMYFEDADEAPLPNPAILAASPILGTAQEDK